MLTDLRTDVLTASDKEKAQFLMRFFKTGKGQYGEGDVFCGITVPVSRKIAIKHKDLSLPDVSSLLKSAVHEERLIALLILVSQFRKGDEKTRTEIFDFYLTHTQYINNWDLVDLSADKIVGEYLVIARIRHLAETKQSHEMLAKREGLPRSFVARNDVLLKLAHSENLWERRIAIIATFAFIKNGESAMTFAIADILLHDKEDLIQKAVGWMLREVGKRISREELELFLHPRYKIMPRTMLRYAIEHFSQEKRKRYLQGSI